MLKYHIELQAETLVPSVFCEHRRVDGVSFLVCVLAQWPEGWQCPRALFGSITLHELVLFPDSVILAMWAFQRRDNGLL